jgi:hypothetical protein
MPFASDDCRCGFLTYLREGVFNATVAGHADSPADRWVDHRYDRGFGNIFRQWEFERRRK